MPYRLYTLILGLSLDCSTPLIISTLPTTCSSGGLAKSRRASSVGDCTSVIAIPSPRLRTLAAVDRAARATVGGHVSTISSGECALFRGNDDYVAGKQESRVRVCTWNGIRRVSLHLVHYR